MMLRGTRRLMSTSSRVGIVGGGPGGLSSAWYLQKKGYYNIAVFEKAPAVGGKCLTVDRVDRKGVTKNLELGAEYVPYHYDHIYDIIKEVDEPTQVAPTIRAIKSDAELKKDPSVGFVDPLTQHSWFQLIPASIKYVWTGYKYKNLIDTPTNKGLGKHPVLGHSVAELIKKKGFEPISGLFLVKQFGYGLESQFPAVQVFRTVHIRTFLRVLVEEIPIVRSFFKRPVASICMNGTQGLFKKLAFLINERQQQKNGQQLLFVDSEVTKIATNNGKVIVSVKGKEDQVFDKLIFALPANNLAHLMPSLESADKELVNKIMYNPYWVGCFEAKDKKLPQYYFQNPNPEGDELVQVTKRWEDFDVAARGYIDEAGERIGSGDPAKVAEVDREFRRLMDTRFGVKQVDVDGFPNKYWVNYYPHVSLEDFQAGFYDKVEGLQGKNGIFLAGGGMLMDTMEQTVKYSQKLINDHF